VTTWREEAAAMTSFGTKAVKTHRSVLWSASLWWLLLSAAASAQSEPFQCAPLVASKSRQPAYGPAPGQPRCEGFYEKNVSQPFLELVSLTRSPPGSWSLDSEGRLNLRGSPKVDTRLLIQPMRSNPLYRVDAWLTRGATVGWHSGTMLQATGLQLRDLGFLAFAGAEPMALAPVSTQDGEQGQTAYAVLRPSVAVSALAWRGYRLASPSALPGTWQDLSSSALFAWERIALPIALPADGLGLRIDVRALDSQGQALPLLQFVVLGANDEKP
jgi:hypothetical protein